eukprot:s3620_g2.t1
MPPGRLSNWIVQPEKAIPEKTQQALARLEASTSRTTYNEAFKHHGPQPPRSSSAGHLKQVKSKHRRRDYATTYSDAYLHFGRESYQKSQEPKLPPQQKTLGPEELRQEQRKVDRQASYWALIRKARSMEEQNKDGSYMQKDFGPLQGNLHALATVLTGEGEAKATFAAGAKSNTWKSEAKSNYTQDPFSNTSAQKYELPAKLVALAKYKNG